MKLTAFLIVCSVVCSIQVVESRARFFSLFGADTFCKGKKDGLYCDGCDKLVQCESNQGYEMLCKDNDVKLPYCNESTPGKATCSATKLCSVSTDAPAPACKQIGRFPDAKYCEVYWECAKDGDAKGTFYSCPPGTRFDPKKEICYKPTKTDKRTCTTYDTSDPAGLCKSKPMKSIANPSRPDVYVKCDGKYQLQMCASNEEFVEKTGKCVFSCTKEGFFKNADGSGFYTCYKDGTTLVMSEETKCKDGGTFDEKLGMCVPKEESSTGSEGNTTEKPSSVDP